MLKVLKISVLILFLIFSYLWIFTYYPENFGEAPSGKILDEVKTSPQYDEEYHGFVNRRKNIIDKMFKESTFIDSFIEYFKPSNIGWPDRKIIETKVDLNKFIKGEVNYIWFGHSTILLRIEGKNILIDPVFSDFVSPISFIGKRFQKPVLELRDLPEIDIVLISHDHFDHLDRESIQFFKDKDVKFIAPLGVDSHLLYWGIDKNKITTLDWWEKTNKENLEFICTPSQHMSGRKVFVGSTTLWASWVVRSQRKSIYFSGDSGYDTHFKKIGEKYGPFDLVFLENGQYNKRWFAIHMMPSETAKAYRDLKAKRLVPIHWGMFNLSLHKWYDPPLRLRENCLDCEIDFIQLGETRSLSDPVVKESKMYKFLIDSEKDIENFLK